MACSATALKVCKHLFLPLPHIKNCDVKVLFFPLKKEEKYTITSGEGTNAALTTKGFFKS